MDDLERFYQSKVCPGCGGEKTPQSRLCQVCYGKAQRRISTRDLEIFEEVEAGGNMAEVGRKRGLSRQRVSAIYNKIKKFQEQEQEAAETQIN